jgi:hypothetical protein
MLRTGSRGCLGARVLRSGYFVNEPDLDSK